MIMIMIMIMNLYSAFSYITYINLSYGNVLGVVDFKLKVTRTVGVI